MAGEYRVTGPAVPAALDRLHDVLHRVEQDYDDIDARDLSMVETAAIEIAGNVIRHGRPSGGLRFDFRLTVSDHALEAYLEDSGDGVDGLGSARDVPDVLSESGRGLGLAAAVVDELTYTRSPGSNVWRFALARHHPTEPTPDVHTSRLRAGTVAR